MKNLGIALIVFGICLEALAIFGNRAPYPLVLKLVSPEYAAAREAYRKLMREGVLEEGDEGFDILRESYMRLALMSPEPPFPLDEIDGVTIDRFNGGVVEDSSELEETRVVVAEFSNGETTILNYAFVILMANGQLKPEVARINAGLLILGCVLVYYGLRVVFLDVKDSGDAAGPPGRRLVRPGAA